MQNLGTYLRKEREKQGLSLEDVAARTKIHIKKLYAIEEGNRDALPAKVFCVGLIKSYARELKVDMTKVDELCKEAFMDAEEKDEPISEKLAPPPAEDEDDESQPVGRFKVPKTVIIGASVLLSGILIFVILQVVEKMNSYSQEEELPQEVFFSQSEEPKVGEPSSSDRPKKKEAKAQETTVSKMEEPQRVTPPPEKKVAQVAPAPQPAAEPKPTPAPAPKKEPEVKPTVQKAPANEGSRPVAESRPPSEPRKTSASVTSDNKLTVTALEPVRAEIVWSDGYVQVMLLKSKETKTLVFSSPLTLRINNGGAVQISYNDGEKKVPGTFNQPIELKYP